MKKYIYRKSILVFFLFFISVLSFSLTNKEKELLKTGAVIPTLDVNKYNNAGSIAEKENLKNEYDRAYDTYIANYGNEAHLRKKLTDTCGLGSCSAEEMEYFEKYVKDKPQKPLESNKISGQTGTPNMPTEQGDDTNLENLGGFVAKLINAMFQMIIDAINKALVSLSEILLAITILLACLDIAFVMLSGVSNMSIVQALGSSIPRYISYIVVITLLKVTDGKSLYMKLTIGDFTPEALKGNGAGSKSLMTGFLKLAEGFFPKTSSGVKMANFSSPGTVVESLLAIPFKLIKEAIAADGVVSSLFLFIIGLGILYYIIQLAGQIIMAIIEYMFVVGLSAIYLPFLVNSATASVGGKVVSNIISKGVGLTIQIGLIGVAITILTTNFTANADTVTFSQALEILLTTSIAIYVAGKGSSIARSILTGEGTGLKASEFITRGAKLLSNVTKVALAAATGGAALMSAKLSSAKKLVKTASQAEKLAKSSLDGAKSGVMKSIGNIKDGAKRDAAMKMFDKTQSLNKQIGADSEKTKDLEDKVNYARQKYGEDSVQHKAAKEELNHHSVVAMGRVTERDKLMDTMSNTMGININQGTLDKITEKDTKYQEAKELKDKAVDNFEKQRDEFREKNIFANLSKHSDRAFQTLNNALGGDKQDFSNFVSTREQLNKKRREYWDGVKTNRLKNGTSFMGGLKEDVKKGVVGTGIYTFHKVIGIK